MDIILPNQITVRVTQSPLDPLPGDTVIFSTEVVLDNAFDYELNNNFNYFYSYEWTVSRDNGFSFVSAGPDLDTLTLENISQSFYGEIYKLEVTLIDLNNMILTEDGDVLASHQGAVLLVDNTGILSIQNEELEPEPNVHAETISNKSSPSEEALQLLDVNSTTSELAEFDPLIDDETADTINSSQGLSARESVAQNIDNPPLEVFLDDFVDESEIVLPTEAQSVSIQNNNYERVRIFQGVGCKTYLMYLDCQPSIDGEFSSLEDCMSGNTACNFNDPNRAVTVKLKEKVNIGEVKNWKLTQNGTTETYCCPNTVTLCPGGPLECTAGGFGPLPSGCTEPDTETFVIKDTKSEADKTDCECEPTGNNTLSETEIANALDPVVSANDSTMTAGGVGPAAIAAQAAWEALKAASKTVTGSAAATGIGRVLIAAGSGAVSAIFSAAGLATIAITAIVIGGIIVYQMTKNGEPVEEYTCKRKYLDRKYRCEPDTIITLKSLEKSPDDKFEEIPQNKSYAPAYTCQCNKGGNSVPGSVTTEKDPDGCNWYIVSQTSLAGAFCRCSLNSNNTIDTTITRNYEFYIPSTPPTCDENDGPCLFTKSSGDFRDCYSASGTCSSKCTSVGSWPFSSLPTDEDFKPGFLCCNNSNTTVFTAKLAGSYSKQCNRSLGITIESQSMDEYINLDACSNPDALNTKDIATANITERPKECNDIVDNIALFDSYDAASAYLQSQVLPDTVLVIAKYKPITDQNNTKIFSGEIVKDNIVIAPALESYYSIVYDGYDIIGEVCDDLCDTWYLYSVSPASHPCNDAGAGSITCGNYSVSVAGKCNNTESDGSTDIKIATITRLLTFNKTDIPLFASNPNASKDCATIIAKADAAVDQGLICTDW